MFTLVAFECEYDIAVEFECELYVVEDEVYFNFVGVGQNGMFVHRKAIINFNLLSNISSPIKIMIYHVLDADSRFNGLVI